MAVTLSADQLNDTDGKVLATLREGRVTPRYLADRLDVSRPYASERLKRLVEHGHVSRPAPGLYELVDDPRSDAPTESADDLRGRLQDAHERIDDLETSLELERETSQERKEMLEDCRELLRAKPDPDEIRMIVDELEGALDRGDRGDVEVLISRLKTATEVDR